MALHPNNDPILLFRSKAYGGLVGTSVRSVRNPGEDCRLSVCNLHVRRGLSAADKSRLSAAMLEAKVGRRLSPSRPLSRAFSRSIKQDSLVDPRVQTTQPDRTDRFRRE